MIFSGSSVEPEEEFYLKYNPENKRVVEYKHDFDGAFADDNIKEHFIEIIEEEIKGDIDNIGPNSRLRRRILKFNHYDIILKKLKENRKKLEEYYKLDNVEEKGWGIFSSVQGEITLNTLLQEKSVMEYKYNPQDYIIGGQLKLYAEELPEKYAEEEESEENKQDHTVILKGDFDYPGEGKIFVDEFDEEYEVLETEEIDLAKGSEVTEEEITIPNNSYINQKKDRKSPFFHHTSKA